MQPDASNQPFNMGELKKSFGPNMANARMILYVMPVFILVGLVFISPVPIGGVGMFLVAGLLFWGYRAQLRARTDIYEKGVSCTDWLGRSQSFHWEDVTAVYEVVGHDVQRGRWRARTWVYWVHLKDGRRVKFDMAYERIQNIGYMILSETGKTFLPRSLELYKAGQTVSFGNTIGISPQGLVSADQTLAWQNVSEIRITETADLIIRQTKRRTPWKLVMHSKIANYPTFRALLSEALKGTPAEKMDPSKTGTGSIGTTNAVIGYDVRELMMEGYDLMEIRRVASGEITLDELRKAGPEAKKTKRK
jgi:hypothetical protein